MNDFAAFAEGFPFASVVGVPLSALNGDNIVQHGVAAPWYDGPTLLEQLEAAKPQEHAEAEPFRLPVQWVNRPDPSFRGYAGLIGAGTVAVGDRVRVLPSGAESRIAEIVTLDGKLQRAVADQSVTVVLADDVDVSRGDVLTGLSQPARVSTRLKAR